jgi:hypothetical protein
MDIIAMVAVAVLTLSAPGEPAARQILWRKVLVPQIHRMCQAILYGDPMTDDMPPAEIHPPLPSDDGDNQPAPVPEQPSDPDDGDDVQPSTVP